MTPTKLPHTIRYYSSGWFATLFLGVFVMFGLHAAAGAAVDWVRVPSLLAEGVAIGIGLVTLLFLLFFFSNDHVAQVDDKGLLFTSQSRLGPFRGRVEAIADVQWSELPEVLDVTRTSLTKSATSCASAARRCRARSSAP